MAPSSIAVAAACIGLAALALAWTVGPLSGVLDPSRLAAQAARLRDWPPAPLAVVAVFVVGAFAAIPLTLLIATTAILFGPSRGAPYAYVATLVSGSVTYAVGRFAARGAVERWLEGRGDPRLARFHRRVRDHGFATVALMRLTPIPFVLQNMAMGAARIGYGDFVLGTALGIVPAVLISTGIATQVDAWIASPDLVHAAGVVAALCVVGAGGWAIRRWLARRP